MPLSRMVLVFCLLAGNAAGVWSQDYPVKPIRIVTGNPGGGSDFNAREVARALGTLGQPVVVDNRASILVGEVGAKTAPDGYNLTVHGASLWLGPFLQKFNYNMTDFAPVALISREVMVLAVHPSVPVKSAKELLAMAKARPGDLMFASSTPGGPPMLGLELLRAMTGIKFLVVPYKGTSQGITAVVAGESHLTVGDLGLVVPQAKSGRLRALAVTSLDSTSLAPEIPALAMVGLPGYEVTGVTALWSTAKTPQAILNRLNQEVVRYLNQREVKDRFLGNIMEVVASTPEALNARMSSDLVKWGKIFEAAGLKPQ